MKIIIAGGRDFTTEEHYELLKEVCSKTLSKCTNIEIVSGGAQGADALGERFAKEFNYDIKLFPANWKEHGRAAGPIRNREMAEYANALIAFWDNKSRGTKNMIEEAKKRDLQVKVQIY